MTRPTESQLHRYVSGESDLPERQFIAEWASESPENDAEVKMLRKLFLASLMSVGSSALSEKKSVSTVFRWMAAVCSVAAALLVGFFTGRGIIGSYDAPETLYSSVIQVPEGQRAHTFLSDGTEVWLNSNSSLEFDNHNTAFRHVVLDGEAWFDVAKDEKHPFIVETSHNKIQVKGTVFDVRSYHIDDDIVVKLYEGAVEVKDSSDSTICALLPNEMLVSSDGLYEKRALTEECGLDWKSGFYSFNSATFETIFKSIGGYFNTSIVICDDEVGQYRCTCRFKQKDSLNHILESMSLVHAFRWEWNEDETAIMVYRK